jgi:hypothetical protein
MTNGTADYASLFDRTKLTAGGAGGVLTVRPGRVGRRQGRGELTGVRVPVRLQALVGPWLVYTPHTRILSPFSGMAGAGTESLGLQLGTGHQDNYVKLVVSRAGGGSVSLLKEVPAPSS